LIAFELIKNKIRINSIGKIVHFSIKLTLIIGGKCPNGVAIIADTKITCIEGTFFGYEQKLYGELTNVLFGCAGNLDIIYLFRMCVVGQVVMLRDAPDKYTDINLLDKIKEIMCLFKRIRNGEFFQLTIMIARLIGRPSRPDLHVIDSLGRIDSEFTRPYKAIGSGTRMADPLLVREWNENMLMKDFAKLSYCIIKYIEDVEPQGSVGVGGGRPHIRYLPYNSKTDIEPTEQEWTEFRKSVPKCVADFREKYSRIAE